MTGTFPLRPVEIAGPGTPLRLRDMEDTNNRKRSKGSGRNAFEISAITVSYSPAPDARYRLRRIITMMIKHAARDRRAARGENAPPSDLKAEDDAETDA